MLQLYNKDPKSQVIVSAFHWESLKLSTNEKNYSLLFVTYNNRDLGSERLIRDL